MKLNAPDLDCKHCQGTGVHNRQLKLVVDGMVAADLSIVALHCRCLSPELAALHDNLGKDDTLHEWPWEMLAGLAIPRAKGGPEPLILGSPFPQKITFEIPRVAPRPKKVEAAKVAPKEEPAKPKKKVKKR